jgi:hypothetical protein
MATATSNTKTANQADAAAQSLRDVNEQVLDFGRKTSATILDAYETTFKTVADYQDKVADSSQVEWVSNIAHAQAELTRGVAKVYASTARGLIK